jgi:putative PIN family toxin of toxin-antitoxin system
VKAVLDTNVLLSAFLTDGICARILKRARAKEFAFVFGTPVLEETQRLLKGKFGFTDRQIAFFISILTEAADEIHKPSGTISGICRDPNDESILLCAIETEADHLVTGDNDLLVLNNFRNIKIISPRDFESLFD